MVIDYGTSLYGNVKMNYKINKKRHDMSSCRFFLNKNDIIWKRKDIYIMLHI